MPRKPSAVRRVCFVTGTRAEFGLMRPVLLAIRQHAGLKLQIIATGMHLSRKHGHSVDVIRSEGWTVDAVVPWRGDLAVAAGRATAEVSKQLVNLDSDIVLVCGDRVEAFAGATPGFLSGKIVAHVHGGDRAVGQVDDSLRHAITKLSHVHFPATAGSARRIAGLGEDAERIHLVGSPGVDGIHAAAADFGRVVSDTPGLAKRRYALLLLHPVDADDDKEHATTVKIIDAARACGVTKIAAIYPNNDPGSAGIIRALDAAARQNLLNIRANVTREVFLGLLRDAAFLIGNSSAGIIEAGSFTTSVIDVGSRQQGRERSAEVIHVNESASQLRAAIRRVWNDGKPLRTSGKNVYGGQNVGEKIARVLANLPTDAAFLRKVISY